MILRVEGAAFSPGALRSRKPGDTIAIDVRRTGGRTANLRLTFGEDPQLEAVSVEATGRTPTAEQRAFRAAWLGAKRN